LTLDDDDVEQAVVNRYWVLLYCLTGSKYLNRVRFRIALSLFKQRSKQNSNENETNNRTTNDD
jgi:hypothetical protein